MAKIIVNASQFDIDGIVFDKDGTLIDFHATWGPILRNAIIDLVKPYAEKQDISKHIYRTLGVEPISMTAYDGPYSIATVDKIYTVVATVLYQHGIKWTDAESRVLEIFKPIVETPPGLEQLKPTVNLPELFAALENHGIKTAVATADNRRGTVESLKKLKCDTDSLFLACGDDLALPAKPDPDLLHQIANIWNTKASRLAMVGDTVGDVYMAQQAGAISIGVLTGAGSAEALSPYTHAVLDSIAQISLE